MALLYSRYNSSTGKNEAGSIYHEVTFVVIGAGATEFELAGYATLTATCKVDVLRNGQLLQVGEDEDYTIDVGNNKIVFNYTVPITSKIKIKVFG